MPKLVEKIVSRIGLVPKWLRAVLENFEKELGNRYEIWEIICNINYEVSRNPIKASIQLKLKNKNSK